MQTVRLGKLHRHCTIRRLLALDTMTLGFLVGVVASTISVFLIVQLTGEKRTPQTITRSRRPQVARAVPSRRQTKPKRTKSKSIRKLRMKTKPNSAKITVVETPPMSSLVSACPACGLQAPDNLMAEHFIGSPSHQFGPVQPLPTTTVTENIESSDRIEEDSKNSLRSLLQMLVPPRAFGRRHAHRTVSPLSRIVETTRDSSHASFRP